MMLRYGSGRSITLGFASSVLWSGVRSSRDRRRVGGYILATLQETVRGEPDRHHTRDQLAVGADPVAFVLRSGDADSIVAQYAGS